MQELLLFFQNQFRSHTKLDPHILRKELPLLASSWLGARDQTLSVHLYSNSIQVGSNTLWFMARCRNVHWLIALGDKAVLSKFEGKRSSLSVSHELGVFPLISWNAQALRKLPEFEWLKPKPFGLKPTFGCGDRLGLATPGHIQAARSCNVRVLLAQQSIREMTRTQRTPQEVMDDAMWGVFQEGYTEGFGADADHLKTFQDVEVTAAVGFTMFTIDPSEYVDRSADKALEKELDQKLKILHSEELPVAVSELISLYTGKNFEIPSLGRIMPTPFEIKRAVVKYGRAVAHTEKMARHIAKTLGGKPYDLEMSVDETDNPTTPVEHLFVGLELKRRKITVHSLALRFIGEFQKGIDYIGDLQEFEKSFACQFAIAQFCGPYKMSIHSGSDKFSIFPIIGRVAGSLVHEKTAGTSYLEALRAVAQTRPDLFREICQFALERYDADKATYHVAEKLDRLPSLNTLRDEDLETLFENNHGRQLLHVTFGSVLNEKSQNGSFRFKNQIFGTLREHEALYAQLLKKHFTRHMQALGMASCY